MVDAGASVSLLIGQKATLPNMPNAQNLLPLGKLRFRALLCLSAYPLLRRTENADLATDIQHRNQPFAIRDLESAGDRATVSMPLKSTA